MLKKLQNLLFEEEDEDIEDDEVVEQAAPVQTVRQEAEAPKQQQPLPSMTRIDMEENRHPSVQQEVKEPSFDSIFAEPEPAKEEKKQSLGITLDPVEKPKPVEKKEEPVRKVAKQPVKPTKPVQSSGYQFKPVISPIFGVDEKDLNAVKNTARKYSTVEKTKTDMNISPIISPMYGSNSEDSPSLIGDTVERSEILEKTVGNAASVKAEDEIPEFSLDDILSSRDEEFKEDITPIDEESTAEISSFFKKAEELDDETKVLPRTEFPSDEGLD